MQRKMWGGGVGASAQAFATPRRKCEGASLCDVRLSAAEPPGEGKCLLPLLGYIPIPPPPTRGEDARADTSSPHAHTTHTKCSTPVTRDT